VGAAGGDDPAGLIRLVRVTAALPDGFEALRAAAEAEGHRHLERLAAEWAERPAMFHALMTAWREGGLVAVGGITDEPEPAAEPAWRMRRLYVAPAARRMGVARTLVNALLQEALGAVRLVTVHAPAAKAARFWEAVGFSAVAGRPWSHELRG
jgi:GNAT superfamily N-acetyltransferase